MKKREFLKILGVSSVAALAVTQLKAEETKADSDEEWKNDPGNKHTPIVKITRNGDVASISIDVTKHPQTEDHHIDGIEVRDASKKKIFSAAISADNGVSIVVCNLKLPVGTKLTALSHCNKHGYYQAPITL